VIMCCLVSAATQQRVQWYGSMEKCWIHEQREQTEEIWRKKICISARSVTMDPTQSDARFNCSYSVTAPNYLTSGCNNIHLKCAQHNCMDTPLIIHCALILEPIQNAGKYRNYIQWVSRPAASLVSIWQIFKKNIRYNLPYNCKKMSAGLPLLFSVSALSSNYNNYPLCSSESNTHGQYFSFIVWTVQFTASIELSNSLQLYVPTNTVRLRHCVSS
jgi:hypothetical protein